MKFYFVADRVRVIYMSAKSAPKRIFLLLLLITIAKSSFGVFSVRDTLQKISSVQNDSVRADLYERIVLHYKFFDLDSAVLIANLGRNEFLGKRYRRGVEVMNTRLGEIDIARGDLDVAEKRISQCLQYFTAEGMPDLAVNCMNLLGRIASQTGKTDEGIAYFLKALKEAQLHHYEEGVTMSYTNLGLSSVYTNDLDAGLDYYRKAIASISDTVKDVRMLTNLYLNISSVYGINGNYNVAKQYSELVMEKCAGLSLSDVSVAALMNLAIVLQHSGNPDQAMVYLNDAMKLAIQNDRKRDEVQILVNMASVAGMKVAENGIPYLNDALAKAFQLKDISVLDDVYSSLIQVHRELGNYKLLSEYLTSQMALRDSMYSVGKARETANLESMFELERSKSKLKELEVDMGQQKQKRNVLIVVACALLTISAILVVTARNRKRLFDVVKNQNAALEKSNGIKDKLFSIIGHDLRAPMGNISSVVSMLQEQVDEESRVYVLGLLKQQAEYTLGTLDSLLLWGKSQMVGGAPVSVVFDVNAIVTQNIRLLQMSAASKRLTISSNVIEKDSVVGDPSHYDFIFRNLLSNAIKYSREGGDIKIRGDRSVAPGFYVLSVSDAGVGMSPERVNNLFKTMGVTTQGTSGEAGTGIGLMLCSEFVSLNGGKIWVESSLNIGTSVFYSFPLA